jgi:hypothetical protein
MTNPVKPNSAALQNQCEGKPLIVMNRHDYAQEVGMKSESPRVPWPVALIVIVALAIAAWYGVHRFGPKDHREESPKKAAIGHVGTPQV